MVSQVAPLNQQHHSKSRYMTNVASYKMSPSSASIDVNSDISGDYRSNYMVTSEGNEPSSIYGQTTEFNSSHASLSIQSDGISSISSTFEDLFGQAEGKKGKMKKLFKECCPAPHTLQNILLLVFLIQTSICIGSLIILFYSSGEQSVKDITTIREKNIIRKITAFIDVAPTILESMRNGIMIQDHKLNFKFSNSYIENCRRIRSVFGPSKNSFPSSSIFYYGNNIRNYCAVEKSVTRDTIQIRDDNATALIYSRDEFYEPVTLNQASLNYDPTIRPWYRAALSKRYPDYTWSPVFLNAFIGSTSLGASTTLDFIGTQDYVHPNGTVEIRNISHVVGAHFDLYNIDSLLVDVIENNKDMQTISISVIIVERHGLIISSSFGAQTKDLSNVRNHLSNTTNVFAEVSKVLESRKILYPLQRSMWGTAASIPTSTIQAGLDPNADLSMFFVGSCKISMHEIKNENNLDWLVVIATEDHGFVKTIFTSSPALLSVSIILIFLGTILMIIVTQFITRSIWKVSRDMYKISKLEVEEVKPSKVLKTMYELDLLQTSIRTVKNGLHSFMKYIPRDIVKDIVRTGNSSKLGMANANSSVMFTDIADFTSFSESSSLSVLLKILTEYFNIITECVENNDGIIDKFIGDGTMSLFSNPLRVVPDHAIKATRAAMTALFRIDRLKTKCQKENLPIIKIRIGINTGNCLIGNIGSRDRFSFTAIGDTVNTAGRLEMLNKRYDTPILIGNNTYEVIKNSFICMYVDSVKLKGKSKPTEVYTVDGEIEEISFSQKVVSERLLRVRDCMFEKKFEEAVEVIESIYEVNNQWKEAYKAEELVVDYSAVKYISELKRRAQYLKNMAEKNGNEDYVLTLTEK